ncbi:MAG: large-conductance mechanosensitive channel protein MscL [Bacteroidota bacterium]
MGFIKEFKEFAIRGNVVDLAVGVIIGASFNKIVDVFVNGIILPPLGYITGGLNYNDKKLILRHAITDTSGKVTEPENAIKYGELIQAVIIFIITAFAIFILIKGINTIRRKQDEDKAEELSHQEKLLTEIRDLLKK